MINKLCCGTVKMGIPAYGINFQHEPTHDESHEMIVHALSAGITWFDTAAAYGDAELILGDTLAYTLTHLISKLLPNSIDPSCDHIERTVEDHLAGSLRRLNTDSLECYLLHTPEYVYNPRIIAGLMACRDKGMTKHIGVSVYGLNEAWAAVNIPAITAVELPLNFLDQRMEKQGIIAAAREKGMLVLARQPFLQGLILMAEEKIPEHLSRAKGYLQIFDEIISRYGFTRIQAALLFSLTNPDIDKVVFGVDCLSQLMEDIEIAKIETDFTVCREELMQALGNIEDSIIIPSLWKR